ncbi:putative inactive cadmium/zinc-transporting ATPase HMA3, partial [Tanacetum coccineum]
MLQTLCIGNNGDVIIDEHSSSKGADTGEEVNANHMEVNTRVAVKAGTMIPIDRVVVEGNCEVGEQALTGESFPSFIKGHVGANHSSNAGVGREGVCIRLNRVAMSY